MENAKPESLTDEDFEQLADIKEVSEGFGIEGSYIQETKQMSKGKELKMSCYGAKWDFVSGTPGYVGPIACIFSDGAVPMMFKKVEGKWTLATEE